MSADTTGVLQLASNNGTVAVTVDTGQILAMGTTDTTNTSRLKLASAPTNNRATSAQLTVQRTNPATQYEGVCFNVGAARAAYILRIPGSDDLTFGFDTGASTAEAMRLTTAGSLCIGTTSSSSAKFVAYSSGATFPLIRAQSDSPTGSGVYGQFNAKYGGTDRDWFFGQASDGSFGIWDFTPGVTNRLTINTSGNVLMGTTSLIGGDSGRLSIDTGGGLALLANRTGDGNLCRWYREGSNVGNINVTAGGTAYNTSSDYRLKNSIAPITGALEKVALLKPCTYKWNADGSDGQGFIAHELAEVVPDCVTGEKDAVETYTDEDGNEATRPAYQGIDTSFLVATLTAAIQELNAKVTDLEEQVLNLGVK
jgi:hypothetical protein